MFVASVSSFCDENTAPVLTWRADTDGPDIAAQQDRPSRPPACDTRQSTRLYLMEAARPAEVIELTSR